MGESGEGDCPKSASVPGGDESRQNLRQTGGARGVSFIYDILDIIYLLSQTSRLDAYLIFSIWPSLKYLNKKLAI